MFGLAAILAGLFMLAVQGAGILKALMSGIIISRSYGAPRIERATEKARFDKLIRQRTMALGPALIAVLIGLAITFRAIFAEAASVSGG